MEKKTKKSVYRRPLVEHAIDQYKFTEKLYEVSVKEREALNRILAQLTDAEYELYTRRTAA